MERKLLYHGNFTLKYFIAGEKAFYGCSTLDEAIKLKKESSFDYWIWYMDSKSDRARVVVDTNYYPL